jgi:selenium-binding protein 1
MLQTLRPDPTFHPSPRLAMEAEPEHIAYTVLLSPDRSRPDALAVIDVDPQSATYGSVINRLVMPYTGDEFHHFGWNACSSALSPMSGHAFLQRRYLIIPGIRSSRIYIVDTQPDPRNPQLVKTIEPEELMRKTGYSRPTPCIAARKASTSAPWAAPAPTAPRGRRASPSWTAKASRSWASWEIDRGPQKLHYDFWWNLPRDYMVSSEWGLPPQFENGIVPEDLLANKYGHAVHFWNLRERKHLQTIDLGANHQMALEIRPAHDPDARIRLPGRGGRHDQPGRIDLDLVPRKRHIPDQEDRHDTARTGRRGPASALLKGFGAVPPLISDIDLSLDDRFLYVACWGTGELRQYDVTDPMKPVLAGSVRIGGIAAAAKHPNGRPFGGGPQMTEISRDGKRVYFTNSLYSSWDTQFYPDGVPGVQLMCNVGANGGIELDPSFYVDFGPDYAAHQIRLQGGDCSTDSFCYPSA